MAVLAQRFDTRSAATAIYHVQLLFDGYCRQSVLVHVRRGPAKPPNVAPRDARFAPRWDLAFKRLSRCPTIHRSCQAGVCSHRRLSPPGAASPDGGTPLDRCDLSSAASGARELVRPMHDSRAIQKRCGYGLRSRRPARRTHRTSLLLRLRDAPHVSNNSATNDTPPLLSAPQITRCTHALRLEPWAVRAL